jgi:hypothetical protein
MSGDETEPYRHFDTEGRVDQEYLEAAIRATPVETRPLLDLEKLRASFEFGPSQREPTAVVSPVRYGALTATRPTRLASRTVATPCATEQKMIRPTNTEIRRINRSPRVRIKSADWGQAQPMSAPTTMPAKTCADMSLYNGLRRALLPGSLIAVAMAMMAL